MSKFPSIDNRGDIVWTNNEEEIHRGDDKPAVIWNDGRIDYYKNNYLHRDNDQPACIYPHGLLRWFLNGKFQKERFR